MVVRHHRSVMTNRMLLQNSIAERSTVLRIGLESSGCRPNHPLPYQVSQESLAGTVEGVQQVRLQWCPRLADGVDQPQGR
jgi:hypothetical protein